jgi:hypothetical protein
MAQRVGIEPQVDVQGIREFRRDLKRLQPDIDRELRGDIREAGGKVLPVARAFAPTLTGELARSIRLSVTQRGVSIYSTLPQAPVLHWGGEISPRGVPITFPRTEFISEAVERQADELLDDIGDGVERAARKTGWHR